MLEQIWSLNQVFGKINKMIIIKSFSVRRLRASWTSPQRRHVPRPFPFWKHYFVKFRPNLPSYRRGGRTDPSPWWRQTFFSINTGANGCIQGCLSVSLLETTSGCPSLRITAKICFLFKRKSTGGVSERTWRLLKVPLFSRPLGCCSLNDSVQRMLFPPWDTNNQQAPPYRLKSRVPLPSSE